MSQKAVNIALNAPSIELIPGSGVSILGVLNIVCTHWKPKNSRGKTIKNIMCNYIAAPMSPENRRAMCEALFNDGHDNVLESLLIEAISQASAMMLQEIGNKMNISAGECALACSSSGVAYEVQPQNIARAMGEIGAASFSGDGFDFGGLLAESVSQVTAWASTQALCCVTTLVGDLTAKAISLAGKLDFGKRVAQLRTACNKVLEAGGDEPVAGGGDYTPGWGGEGEPPAPSPAPAPAPAPPPPTGPPPTTAPPAGSARYNATLANPSQAGDLIRQAQDAGVEFVAVALSRDGKALLARVADEYRPAWERLLNQHTSVSEWISDKPPIPAPLDPSEYEEPPLPALAPPPPPEAKGSRNWIPYLVAFAGVGTAVFFVARSR